MIGLQHLGGGLSDAAAGSARGLTDVAWCVALSYVLRSGRCLARVRAVSRHFNELSEEMLCWDGASACLGTADLEVSTKGGSPEFERLVPRLGLCGQAFLNFKDKHTGVGRKAAQRCLWMLAQHCPELSCLCVRNWFSLEKVGLPVLTSRSSFPKLRHLALTGCDLISSYEAMIPVFEAHPQLLSLRATFHTRAVAGQEFAAAAPRSLTALGFVSFADAEALALLLERCRLEHLWFCAEGGPDGRGIFTPQMGAALAAGAPNLRTLSLPSRMTEEECHAAVRPLKKLELLCRMRVGSPQFGSGPLAEDFEIVPPTEVVVRRRGSAAGLAESGLLWAPYSQGDEDHGARIRDTQKARTLPPAVAAAGRWAAAVAAGRWAAPERTPTPSPLGSPLGSPLRSPLGSPMGSPMGTPMLPGCGPAMLAKAAAMEVIRRRSSSAGYPSEAGRA